MNELKISLRDHHQNHAEDCTVTSGQLRIFSGINVADLSGIVFTRTIEVAAWKGLLNFEFSIERLRALLLLLSRR